MNQGVRVIGLVPGTGYGDGAADLAYALDQGAVPVVWTPIIDGGMERLSLDAALRNIPLHRQHDMRRLWQSDQTCDRFLLSVPPPDWHTPWRNALPDLSPFCYTAWEVDHVPDTWIQALAPFRRVFVPSYFNRNTLMAAGIKPEITVIPHMARPAQPGALTPDLGQIRSDDFLFYSIGAWSTRKALAKTLRAFLDTFDAADPVALAIKTEFEDRTVYEPMRAAKQAEVPAHLVSTAWSVARILGEYPNPARVHLINTMLTPAEIEGLHQRGDCFLSLAHAEGWGMGAFDAAVRDTPVIITGWGGQLDYLGEDYPLLVDFDLRATSDYINDGYFYCASHVHWAEADSAHAGELMRLALSARSSCKNSAIELGQTLRTRFAADGIADTLAGAMGLASNSQA
ncbi:MAG: hypothetical protein AAGI11_00435 [Pseudomonadota bacterium]